MKNFSYLFNLFLLSIAALTGWIFWTSAHFVQKKAIDTSKPDGFMTEVEMTQFSDSGDINFTLKSPKLTHYPLDNTTTMDSPNFTIYTDTSNPPWNITANHGKASHGIDTVFLWDNVIMSQYLSKGSNEETRVTTSEAYYYPNERVAKTDKNVLMMQPGLELDATGLNVYFDTGIAKLLSEVKGNYDPAKSNS